MEIILNLTNHKYNLFLDSKIDTFVLGLKDYSTDHLIEYKINELEDIIHNIHKHNKKLYLSLNIIANEKQIDDLNNIIESIKSLSIDGFVISDFGILQIFREHSLINKVIFNPVTTITNKYSASIANNLGINHICIANELNLNDIIEVSKFNDGKIEILAQGYYQICNSKRPLITNFLNRFRIKPSSSSYFIKEENRDYAYPIVEIRNDLLIYIDKQRCILPYIKTLIESNIEFFRLDTTFLSLEDINTIIEIYHKAIKENEYEERDLFTLEKMNSNLTCLDSISILKKEAK